MSENNTVLKAASSASANSAPAGKAGAFDIRNVIGALLGLYGLILLISYFLLDPGVDSSTGQIKDATYNLWAGVGLVAVAAFFFIWNKLDPIKLDSPDSV